MCSPEKSEKDGVLSELHRQVCFGQARGRIIWQPRIGAWYGDKIHAGKPLPEPYQGMTLPEIYRSLGCSARIYGFNASFRRVEDPRVERKTVWLNETDEQTTISTPVGKQTIINRSTPNSHRPISVKREIETEEEMRVATWRAERTEWEWDQSMFDKVIAEWGDLGAPTMYLPRVNIQYLFINTMGVEKAIYALYDWPDLVEGYFKALDESHFRQIELINESPIDIVNYGDNLHCQTLPPSLYERFVLPSYLERSERLHAGGKFISSHWDGDTKALLPYARSSGLDGIEAITPEPQGDVTLEEIKEALGDDTFLLDGIPAILFNKTFPEERLMECAEKVIELFAPRLILGISDEMSSMGDIERIRMVGKIVDDYNASVAKAEQDH